MKKSSVALSALGWYRRESTRTHRCGFPVCRAEQRQRNGSVVLTVQPELPTLFCASIKTGWNPYLDAAVEGIGWRKRPSEVRDERGGLVPTTADLGVGHPAKHSSNGEVAQGVPGSPSCGQQARIAPGCARGCVNPGGMTLAAPVFHRAASSHGATPCHRHVSDRTAVSARQRVARRSPCSAWRR
jgi:hypothetical protein